MVRGKRNLLPPALLMLGFGVLFKISEQSKGKHVKHRLYDNDAPESAALGESSRLPENDLSHPEAEEESDEDDQGDLQQRANPLQSGAPESTLSEEDEDAAKESGPPTDKLAELELSKDITGPATKGDQKVESEQESSSEDDTTPKPKVAAGSSQGTNTPSSRAGTPSSASQQAKKAPPKRGQRSKAKKIASKYKDQDEEDRALMEDLLGVTAARQKAEAEAAAKAQREAEAAAAHERRRQQQERAKKQIAEHEEIRRMMLEEGVELLDDAEEMESTPLDVLVGTPLPGDEILEIIPICAPWSALGKVKYKAKLQPGNTKKGKAVKEIVERWRAASAKKGVVDESASDPERMWPREVELIKGLKVEEAFNSVPVGKVTVMMAGGGSGGSGGGGQKGGGQKKGAKGGKGGKK